MKPNVVLYHPVPAELIDHLKTYFDLTVFPGVNPTNRDDFLAAARAADGLIGMGLPVSTQELRGAKNLRVITTISAGYDAFDVAELTANKVVLMNLFDPLTDTTADMAFGLLMATARRIVEMDSVVRSGEWGNVPSTSLFGLDIHGKTLGIVGLGRIGAAVAKRGALGFGMQILYTARSPKPEAEEALGARRCDLDELLQASDFVCVVVPLSKETTKLIGEREFGLMKSSAILVNIARGGVIDEAAMIKALQEKQIWGAGLDVFEVEPLPTASPLVGLSNVVLAPHLGSATDETRNAMAAYAAETLIGYLCRGETRNVVNPEALPSPTG